MARSTILATVAVLVVAGGVTFFLLNRPGFEAQGAAPSDLPPNTAKVTRQTLADTTTKDGDLGYGDTTTISNRLPGTITWMPAADAQVGQGQALYKVDEKPVTLLYGGTPAYRRLAEGTEGQDVRQLEQDLSALGYTGFTVDDEYTAATAAAVERWQGDLGLDETGVVELGQVVFAPGEIRVDGVDADPGQPAPQGQRVMTVTGTAKAVTVELDENDRQLAQPGATVRVTLPDNRRIDGRVEEVATVIQPAANPSEQPTTKAEVQVSLGDQQAVAQYAAASVEVDFTSQEHKDVLTVPVAALVALAEGGFGVEVVEGTTTRYVPVHTGLFADGRVEITGVAEGTTVGMPK